MKYAPAGITWTLLAGIYCTDTYANTSLNGGGYYDVETVYASGYESRIRYRAGETSVGPTSRHDRFSILLENDHRVIFTTEHTFFDEYSDSQWTERHQCVIDEQSNYYPEAMELAHRQMEVSKFQIHFSVSTDQRCQSLKNIEYRDDVTQVFFSCHNGHTYWGQSTYITGNTDLLGNWNPENAIKLDSTYYPSWQKSVLVEKDKDVEWKCIKREEQNPGAGIVWQAGDNNRFFSNAGGSQQAIF